MELSAFPLGLGIPPTTPALKYVKETIEILGVCGKMSKLFVYYIENVRTVFCFF